MNIDKAIEELKLGKKIKHQSWGKGDFIALDKVGTPRFFTVQAFNFTVSPEDLLGDEWVEIGSDIFLTFPQALSLLKQNKRLKNLNDVDECYYEMDELSRQIVRRKLVEQQFLLNHAALLSPEWKVLEDE